jgi:hypothetical protein
MQPPKDLVDKTGGGIRGHKALSHPRIALRCIRATRHFTAPMKDQGLSQCSTRGMLSMNSGMGASKLLPSSATIW